MKTSFVQFISEMNRKHKFSRRLISVLCVLSILVSVSVSLLLTMPGLTASTDPNASSSIVELLTDNPTHNGWISYFGINSGSNRLSYNTEFVGSVWTDKSVFKEYTTSKNQVISPNDPDNMLGVLSAIGSSMAITGRIYTPTDVMFILDMSSSMYIGAKDANDRDPNTVNAMVEAVNESISTLLSLNEYNRIGITVYFGNYSTSINNGSTLNHGITLLDLDRYEKKAEGDTPYLSANLDNNNKLTGITANAEIKKTEGSTTVVSRTHNLVYNAAAFGYTCGTYSQLGVQNARNEFMNVKEEDTYITLNGTKIVRQPVFIFMSDGRPTSAHSSFDDLLRDSTTRQNMAEWGLNSEAYRTSDATDFVFQLTSSYSKMMVSDHYGSEALFYTLGLSANKNLGKNAVSMNAMDPLASTSGITWTTAEKNDKETIAEWWHKLIDGEEVSFTVHTNYTDYGWDSRSTTTKYVNRLENVELKDGSKVNFPNNISQMGYVDQYFPAAGAGALSGAFEQIVDEIIVRSIYTPTQSNSNRVNTSGEVSFVDHIGEYMTVKDVTGILFGGVLHTGSAFSKILVVEDESVLGTLGEATEFGMTFWNNLMEQLGLDYLGTVGPDGEEVGLTVPAVAELNKLINWAYEAKQISYTDDSNYSNYIGWYANDKDQYLGFWDGSDIVNPEHLVDPASVPTQRIKTYFFQTRISGDENQTYNTDMMYITVWVKEDMATGQETIVFSVPASLLPTLKYFVKLDENGVLTELYLGSIHGDTVFDQDGNILTRPIRLVYEVGLQDGITSDTLLEKVDSSYLSVEQNVNKDQGRVYFYANEWERDQSTGYNRENTYSYFSPSRFNDRYFYVEDMEIWYKDANGELKACTTETHSTLQHSDDLYTVHPKYYRDGTTVGIDTYEMPVGDIAIDYAVQNSTIKDGRWYLPAGLEHSLQIEESNRFARLKEDSAPGANDANITNTLQWRNVPTIDRTPLATTGTFILAATLGNNGRIAIEPEGQTLQKLLVYGGQPMNAQEDQSFQFLLHEGEALDPLIYADGTAVERALQGKNFTIINLTVKKDNSESGKHELKKLSQYIWSETDKEWAELTDIQVYPTWDCLFTHTYTVVELITSEDYALADIGGSKAGYLTFQYGVYPEGEEDHTIVASNEFAPWDIVLTKIDSQENANVLPGAVFGLYSLNQSDQLRAEEVPEEYKDLATYSYQDQTWYLSSVETTGADGKLTWQKLVRNQYVVLELQAPPGYLPAEDRNVKLLNRTLAEMVETKDEVIGEVISSKLIAYVTVENTPGAELPSTGGSGPFAYICIGAIMMFASAALMFIYHSRRKEERVSA